MAAKRALRALLLVWGSLSPVMASAATNVQGKISTSTTWKKSGSPYVLTGDVTVGWGATLVIEPGVKVVAARRDALRAGVDPQRVEFVVDGKLVVRGTGTEPVSFLPRGELGAWYGIRVRGGRGTVIHGAVITRAWQGLSLDVSAEVRNTTVKGTLRDCLNVGWGSATLVGNRLSMCGANGVSVAEWARVHMEKTVVSGSGGHGAELKGAGELLHDTFHGNRASGVALLSEKEAPVVRDSLITSNGGHGVYKASAARGVLMHNNVWGNMAGDYGAAAFAGLGSISANPLYVSATDLRLGDASPVRGAASDGLDLGAMQTPRSLWAVRSSVVRAHDAASITSAKASPIQPALLAEASVRGSRPYLTGMPAAVAEPIQENVALASVSLPVSFTSGARSTRRSELVHDNRTHRPVVSLSSIRGIKRGGSR